MYTFSLVVEGKPSWSLVIYSISLFYICPLILLPISILDQFRYFVFGLKLNWNQKSKNRCDSFMNTTSQWNKPETTKTRDSLHCNSWNLKRQLNDVDQRKQWQCMVTTELMLGNENEEQKMDINVFVWFTNLFELPISSKCAWRLLSFVSFVFYSS